MTPIKRCKTCAIAGKFPGAKIYTDDCNFCRERDSLYKRGTPSNRLCYTPPLEKGRRELLLRHMKSFFGKMAQSKTPLALAYSGGVDSTYVLDLLVNSYNLSVIPITVDVGALDDRALQNIKNTLLKLGIKKHLLISKYKKMYLRVFDYFLKHLDTLPMEGYNPRCCMVCHHIIDLILMGEVRKLGVRYLISGLDRFQTPPELNFLLRGQDYFLPIGGPDHFTLLTRHWPEEILSHVLTRQEVANLKECVPPLGQELYLICPTWAMEYDKKRVGKSLVKRGILIHTEGTNCKFKPLANALFHMQNGYGINEFVESSKIWEENYKKKRGVQR